MNTIFKGRLTYLVAAVMILWGMVGIGFGWSTDETGMSKILEGLAIYGIRRAL